MGVCERRGGILRIFNQGHKVKKREGYLTGNLRLFFTISSLAQSLAQSQPLIEPQLLTN